MRKYHDTAAAIIAPMKYGSGMAFHRLEHLEKNLGIPLPAATQWEIVEEAAELICPAYEEPIGEAAQGEVLHNDDTRMGVLHLAREPSDERTGVFTCGVVSTAEGRRIALFFTGRQHAGENLADVLTRRAPGLRPPIQMCDALSRTTPKLSTGAEILLGNCLAHGRRQFVEITANFPEECRYVPEALGGMYGNDAVARDQKLSPEERLRFHQEHSRPRHGQTAWLDAGATGGQENRAQLRAGKSYPVHAASLEGATLFLRSTRAPLDNNLCERALKKAILNRKNSLFYKTLHGAQVGDLYMSLIDTCELNGANAFDYLTESDGNRNSFHQDQ